MAAVCGHGTVVRARPGAPGSPTGEAGLNDTAAINLHHIVTVPRDGLTRYVGAVAPSTLQKVSAALLFALGLDA
jgi:mRNA-degrading endonuclease toxin of MazEF toxin-antitoxin module